MNRPAPSTTEFHTGARTSNAARRAVYRILETAQGDDLASRLADIFLISLISLSVIGGILETVPSIDHRYGDALKLFEALTVAVFSVEYLLRIWSAVEASPATLRRPVKSRLRYVGSFHAIIDLLAILPFYVLFLGNVDLLFLRTIRLLRILKLTRYSAALNMLFLTFRENSKALMAAFLILVTVMLLAASGMYYFERQAQPVAFGSIPAAMWWSFATLTTVGYGDVTPVTAGGKVFGALITVVGIGMVALPTSILATGYSRQLQRSRLDFQEQADVALDDGVISPEEERELESLRIDLGLSKNTASQILDAERVRLALEKPPDGGICPHCRQALPPDYSEGGF